MNTRGTSTERLPDWRFLAACNSTTAEAMFPDPGNKKATAQAVGICHGCPVVQQCLTAALKEEGGRSKESRFGIRAGLTPGQRYYLHSRNRQPKPEATKPKEKRTHTGGKPLAPCGTPAAYDRHSRNREPIDDACRLAHNAERREARARRKAAA